VLWRWVNGRVWWVEWIRRETKRETIRIKLISIVDFKFRILKFMFEEDKTHSTAH
jgi:hypothetical protein